MVTVLVILLGDHYTPQLTLLQKTGIGQKRSCFWGSVHRVMFSDAEAYVNGAVAFVCGGEEAYIG